MRRFKQKSRRRSTPRLGALDYSDVEEDQSADFADTDFSDDDLDFDDGFDSEDDDLDSVVDFDSAASFDDVSLDDAVVPLVAGFSVVDAESESVLLGVLFLA
jgi:hypothetical protein